MASREAELYELVYTAKKPLTRKLAGMMGNFTDELLRRAMALAI